MIHLNTVIKMDRIKKEHIVLRDRPSTSQATLRTLRRRFPVRFFQPKERGFEGAAIHSFLEMYLRMLVHPEKSGIQHHSTGTLFLDYRLTENYEAKYQYHEVPQQRIQSNMVKCKVPLQLKRHIRVGDVHSL
jgi:hypothetical protein